MSAGDRTSCPPEDRPTISAVLHAFLLEEESRLSARTFAHYRSIGQLLTIYLNSYGPGHLTGDDGSAPDL